MREFSKFLVTDGSLACPRNAYPVTIDRCFRCRFLRDLQETIHGEDVVCCDYIEVAVDHDIEVLLSQSGN
jgi:hypothetical protein